MQNKKKFFLLNWLRLISIHYKRNIALVVAFFIINVMISLTSNYYEGANFNNIYAAPPVENGDKYIKLYDNNIYTSVGKIDKKSESIIGKSYVSNKTSDSINDNETPVEMPFRSSIPQSELEKLKENIKNKTPNNQSSAKIIDINKSLLDSDN
jgi:hypothetical protein